MTGVGVVPRLLRTGRRGGGLAGADGGRHPQDDASCRSCGGRHCLTRDGGRTAIPTVFTEEVRLHTECKSRDKSQFGRHI